MGLRRVRHQYIYTSERLLREVYHQARAHPRGRIQLTGATVTPPVIGVTIGVGPRPDKSHNVFSLAELALGALQAQTCSLRSLDDRIRSTSGATEELNARTRLEQTGLYLRATLELTWCWLPVANLSNPVAWMYAVHDDPDTKRRTLVGLCGGVDNYRDSVPRSLDTTPGDAWYPSSLMGLRRIFAARAEDEEVRDMPAHEAEDQSIYSAITLTKLHREHIIGSGWCEVLAEVLVLGDASDNQDGYDTIVLGAPLWVRTAPPPLGPDGNSITKAKPADERRPSGQVMTGSHPPAPLPPQPVPQLVIPSEPTLEVVGATLSGIGGVLMVLGSLLPWVVTVNLAAGATGISGVRRGDGLVTLALGLATILIAVMRLTRRRMPEIVRRSSIATGITTALVAVVHYPSTQGGATDAPLAGVGIWSLLAAGVLATAGGVFSPSDSER